MKVKEYSEGMEINGDDRVLPGDRIPKAVYAKMHQGLPILCHDVFINYDNGFVLLQRKDRPAEGEWWPVGGRLERGLPVEISLRKKARAEVGLDLENIQLLGVARHYFVEDPFLHGRGTDTPSLIYFADGIGDIQVDEHHIKHKIVNLKDLPTKTNDFVKEFMFEANKVKYWRNQSV